MRSAAPCLLAPLAALVVGGCGPRAGHQPASEAAPVRIQVTAFHAVTSGRHDVDGAIFGTLQADAADTLETIVVPASVAAGAEVRETTTDSLGRVASRRLPELALPEERPVRLEPGGRFVRLVELARPLRPPHTVTIRLRFTRGGEKVLEVPVRDD